MHLVGTAGASKLDAIMRCCGWITDSDSDATADAPAVQFDRRLGLIRTHASTQTHTCTQGCTEGLHHRRGRLLLQGVGRRPTMGSSRSTDNTRPPPPLTALRQRSRTVRGASAVCKIFMTFDWVCLTKDAGIDTPPPQTRTRPRSNSSRSTTAAATATRLPLLRRRTSTSPRRRPRRRPRAWGTTTILSRPSGLPLWAHHHRRRRRPLLKTRLPRRRHPHQLRRGGTFLPRGGTFLPARATSSRRTASESSSKSKKCALPTHSCR